MMKSRSFEDQVVIITGASSGIGRALALRLSAEGASLALAARNEDRLEDVAAACRQNGGKAVVMPTDVAVEGQCRQLVQRTIDAFGRIDMIVNNAGIDVVCRFEELIDLELFKRVMDVNLYGAVHCTYHALPYLKASKGRIVNISSMAGLIAIPLNTSYVASKFAMNGFSDSLRMELGKTGVSVTVICPYWVVSEFHENYLDKYGKRKGRSGRAIYTRKMMSADQCARIVIEAACKRKREVLLGPGRLAALMKVAAPGWVDRITIRAVLRPLERRMNKGKKGEGR